MHIFHRGCWQKSPESSPLPWFPSTFSQWQNQEGLPLFLSLLWKTLIFWPKLPALTFGMFALPSWYLSTLEKLPIYAGKERQMDINESIRDKRVKELTGNWRRQKGTTWYVGVSWRASCMGMMVFPSKTNSNQTSVFLQGSLITGYSQWVWEKTWRYKHIPEHPKFCFTFLWVSWSYVPTLCV